jgi:hypothetical protein
MADHPDEPFRLQSAPDLLWTVADIAREYGVDVKVAWGWRRQKFLGKTWKRDRYYAPEQIRDRLANHGLFPKKATP